MAVDYTTNQFMLASIVPSAEYADLVPFNSTSAACSTSTKRSGLAWWAIALIVLGSAGGLLTIIAGSIVIFCLPAAQEWWATRKWWATRGEEEEDKPLNTITPRIPQVGPFPDLAEPQNPPTPLFQDLPRSHNTPDPSVYGSGADTFRERERDHQDAHRSMSIVDE